MYILRYLASRVFKLVGNLAKGVFFAVHFVAPSLRFTIPKHAPALIRAHSQRQIPRIVWQTNFTRRVALAVYVNYLFNRLMAPTHEFHMLVDADVDDFIRSSLPDEIYQRYRKLQIGAAKADLWRLLAIHRHGGTYVDLDAAFVWPLELTIGADDPEVFIAAKDGLVTNFFFACAPENPHIWRMIEAVLHNIDENKLTSVYSMTGPVVFQQILEKSSVQVLQYRVVCVQGVWTKEFFQYIDRPVGKWHREQEVTAIVKD